MEFAKFAIGGCRCTQIYTLQTGEMQIPHVRSTPHQIGRQLADLDRDIHAALKDIRRNLEELEEVSRMGATDRGSRTGPSFADVLKDSIREGDSASAEP